MEHTINACGHANSTVHENMQSLIEQSGSVRKYAKDEIIYLQGDTAQSFCYIKKGSVKVYMNSVDGNEKTLNTARHGERVLFLTKSRESVPPRHLQIPRL